MYNRRRNSVRRCVYKRSRVANIKQSLVTRAPFRLSLIKENLQVDVEKRYDALERRQSTLSSPESIFVNDQEYLIISEIVN